MSGVVSRWLGVGLLAACSLTSAPALSQSDEERAAARVAAQRGILAVLEGRYAEGINLLERAESIVHAPTHLLYLARAWEKQGKLVRAREIYLRLANEELKPNAPKAFRDAVAAAVVEANTLEPRLSWVTIRLSDANGVPVSVREDDTVVPSALIGMPRPTDPGAHTYHASAPGHKPATSTVIVTEGDRETVTLTLEPVRDPSSGSGSSFSGSASGELNADADGDAGLRRLGYVALGASSVGIAAGIYFLVQAGKEQSSADDRFSACNSRLCTDDEANGIRQADSSAAKQRTGAALGFAAGGAALAAGITILLLTSGDDEETSRVGVRPYVSPSSAGVFGRF